MLLYAYCVGIVSSHSEFRHRNLDALKGLFVQILRLCLKAERVSLGHVDVTPFIGPGLMRVGGHGHAAAPC